MWRSVLALVLVPSLFCAQESSLKSDKDGPSKQALRQDYLILTEWQSMKRGTNEKVVIRFLLIPSYIVSPYEPSRDLVPLKIEFEESDGVAATSFRFDTDRRVHFTFREEVARNELMLEPPDDTAYSAPGLHGSVGVGTGNPMGSNASTSKGPMLKILNKSSVRVMSPTFEVAVKVKASKKATLGPHLLRGKITYQPIFNDGVLPPQQMELVLPITVVDKDMISLRNPEYMRDYGSQADTRASFAATSTSQKVGLILLAIVIAPLLVLERIACGFWGEDCSC